MKPQLPIPLFLRHDLNTEAQPACRAESNGASAPERRRGEARMIGVMLYLAAAGCAAAGLYELALVMRQHTFHTEQSAAADVAVALAVGPLTIAYSVNKVLQYVNIFTAGAHWPKLLQRKGGDGGGTPKGGTGGPTGGP